MTTKAPQLPEELEKEIKSRLQMIPHPDDRRKFRGLIQRVRAQTITGTRQSMIEERGEVFNKSEIKQLKQILQGKTMDDEWHGWHSQFTRRSRRIYEKLKKLGR